MGKHVMSAAVFATALILAGGVFGQSSNPSTSKGDEDQRRTSDSSSHTASNPSSGDAATPSKVTTGKVERYSADGKTMVVVTDDGRHETLDLKGSVSIDPSIAVGSRVRITESRDTDGNKIVKVDPY